MSGVLDSDAKNVTIEVSVKPMFRDFLPGLKFAVRVAESIVVDPERDPDGVCGRLTEEEVREVIGRFASVLRDFIADVEADDPAPGAEDHPGPKEIDQALADASGAIRVVFGAPPPDPGAD